MALTPQARTKWLLLFGLALVWGGSFLLIKKSLICFSPLQVASLRVGIAGLALSPLFVKEWRKLDPGEWRPLLIVGLAGSGVPAIFFSIAQTQIPSAITGMLNTLTPIFTMILGAAFFSQKTTARQISGVILGLAGAALLISQSTGTDTGSRHIFAALIVMGTVCYALSSNVVKHFLSHRRSLAISTIAYGLLTPAAAVLFLSTDLSRITTPSAELWVSWLSILFLSIVGTAVASIFFFGLVRRTSALFASMVTYLIPVVATLLGIWDGELVNLIQILSLTAIASGVYLSGR